MQQSSLTMLACLTFPRVSTSAWNPLSWADCSFLLFQIYFTTTILSFPNVALYTLPAPPLPITLSSVNLFRMSDSSNSTLWKAVRFHDSVLDLTRKKFLYVLYKKPIPIKQSSTITAITEINTLYRWLSDLPFCWKHEGRINGSPPQRPGLSRKL